jgi:hypothetical protein
LAQAPFRPDVETILSEAERVQLHADTVGPGGTFGAPTTAWDWAKELAAKLCREQRPEDFAKSRGFIISYEGARWQARNRTGEAVALRVQGTVGEPNPTVCEQLN